MAFPEGQKATTFTFYKNTPLTDLENTIHFKSNSERDTFFENHYDKTAVSQSMAFNYVRDRGTIVININYQSTYGINYCSWKTDGDPVTHYAFVTDIEYLNDTAVKFYLVEDGIMTYLQGDFARNLQINNVVVNRQHLGQSSYNRYLETLRTNSDILNTNSQRYVQTLFWNFSELVVIFQSSVNLEKNFGSADDPKMTSSTGLVYDNIASPVSLYYVEYDKWQQFITKLTNYPWITQNFQKILLIPKMAVDSRDLILCQSNTKNLAFGELYRFANNKTSQDMEVQLLTKTTEAMCQTFGIVPNIENNNYEWFLHLLRSQYCNIELTTFNGQQLPIQPEFLDIETGVQIVEKNVIGFSNEIKLYPKKYKERGEGGWTQNHKEMAGASLDYSLSINQFDDVPILIDNYRLSLAQSSHQRNLAESKLLSNRINNIITGSSGGGVASRIMDVISLASNANPASLVSGITNEYEFYRTQKAEFDDKKITSPTVTSGTGSNNFLIGKKYFGCFLRFSCINSNDMEFVKKYHALFGFEFNKNMNLESVESMPVVNFVKFSGNWNVPNIDTKIFSLIKAQLENGVKFWHNQNVDNPFKNDLVKNQIPKDV